MPSKYPVLPPSEVVKALKKIGFVKVGQKGSHMKYSDGVHVVIIPNHSEVAKGTLKSILDMAGVPLDEFMRLI